MKLFNPQIISFSLIIVLMLFPIAANAQSTGRLDPAFGSGGMVATHLYTQSTLYDMAVQPDKKIIIAGTTFTNFPSPMPNSNGGSIARFNEDGTLDTTFSGDGINNDQIMREIHALYLLPDGKIMVGGFTTDGFADRFCLARLNSNGTLDTTFDQDGVVETTLGYSASLESLEVLPDGKILAIGWLALASDALKDVAMVKYNSNGSLDMSFGSGGRVGANFGYDDFAFNSAIQADGKIVLGGYYHDPLPNEYVAAIYRFSANGSVDTTFGTNGRVSRTGGQFARADDIEVQSDGKIVIVGTGIPPVRYHPNGTLDTVFNTPAWASTSSVVIQSNGKMVVRGVNTSNNCVIIRYNANGTPEKIFPTEGNPDADFYFPSHVLIAPDGKIVTGGTRLNFNFETVLARFLNDTARVDFDGDSKTDISTFRPSVGEWWYLRSSDGGNRAFQFGTSSDRLTPADFTGDGRADIAFWRPSTGEWFILRSEDLSYYSFPLGASGDIPASGDYDADGKADAAVFRPSAGVWYINKSSGGTIIQQFGTAGDVPVTADYDGDGKSDIAIYRPSAGEWWIQRSTAGLLAFQFGTSSDKAVQGDYTGDGRADAAFWRPATGEWFVLRSEDLSYYSFPFGTNGDAPSPGDYDGDGKSDAAVFRPSTSTWYAQRTTAGTLIQQFGAPGDMSVPGAFVP